MRDILGSAQHFSAYNSLATSGQRPIRLIVSAINIRKWSVKEDYAGEVPIY